MSLNNRWLITHRAHSILENEAHLLPLLQQYLSYLDPTIKDKPEIYGADYEFIKNPDGSISSFKLDVLDAEQAGGDNIKEGYWNAIAKSLQDG